MARKISDDRSNPPDFIIPWNNEQDPHNSAAYANYW
jgi:hypothetical protein